jgi:hypothetical protein
MFRQDALEQRIQHAGHEVREDVRHATAWLNTDAPLRIGQKITTVEHGPSIVWTVTFVGSTQQDSPPSGLYRTWMVGGLK